MVPIFIPMIIPFKVGAGAAASLTAGQVALGIGIGTAAAVTAGVVADKISRDPVLYDKLGNIARFSAAAVLYSPVLAAEDVARACGAKIPKEGFLCNDEGKSIWQIWNESKPLTAEEQRLVREAL